MTTKTNKTLEELHQDLKEKVATGTEFKDRSDVVKSAYKALGRDETDLCCWKSFDGGEVRYERGMLFRLGSGKWETQMIDQGYFCAPVDWDALQEQEEAKRLLVQVDKIIESLATAKLERKAAQAQVRALGSCIKELEADALRLLS